MKKLFLGLTIVASVMGMGFEAKAAEYRTIARTDYNGVVSATYDVTENVTYCYSEVQATLDTINNERVTVGKVELTLDKGLTDLAMQRAAECTIIWSHRHPDGSSHSNDEAISGFSGVSAVNHIIDTEKNNYPNTTTVGGHYATLVTHSGLNCGIGVVKGSDGNYITVIITDTYSKLSATTSETRNTDVSATFTTSVGVDWFWGLATQDEFAALSTAGDKGILKDDHTNAANANFVAFTKSERNLETCILSSGITIGSDYYESNGMMEYLRPISAGSATYEVVSGSDCLSIDSETGVMKGLKAGTAQVKVTLKNSENVKYGATQTYTITVLAGGIEYEEDTVPMRGTVMVPKFVPEETTPAVQPTTTVIEEQTIESKIETTTEQSTTETKTTETKNTTETKKTTTKTDNYKPAAPLKVKASKKGKKVTVKYGSVYKATSYEIQISTSKKFKSAKSVVITGTSKSIKVKSSWTKKTMYVRVRAINGTKKSSWSSVKKIKK